MEQDLTFRAFDSEMAERSVELGDSQMGLHRDRYSLRELRQSESDINRPLRNGIRAIGAR